MQKQYHYIYIYIYLLLLLYAEMVGAENTYDLLIDNGRQLSLDVKPQNRQMEMKKFHVFKTQRGNFPSWVGWHSLHVNASGIDLT